MHVMDSFWWVICLCSTTFLSVDAQSVAPYFITTPTNTTAVLHSSVRLECDAYGVPTPIVKWVKYTDSGQTVIQTGGRYIVGAVFGYLYILGIHWSDAGRYGCVAQNEHGRVVADAHITIVTESAPSWQIKPDNVTLYEGQEYTLPCKAHGYPEPSYFWSHKGSLIVDIDVKVLFNNYLFFSNAKSKHSGWYTCTASNLYGFISHSVYVDVVSDPSIVIQPEDVPTVRGGKITLSCGVVGSTTLNVKWLLNDSNLPDDTLISFTRQTWTNAVQVHTLNIKKARRRHLGKYYCIVKNAKGTVRSSTAKVFFSKYITPLKVEVPNPAVVASEGSDVELKCVFIGSPTPQVTWYKDGKEVIDIGFPIIQPVNTRCEAILKLSSAKQSVSGHFVCVGQAGIAGTAEGNITLVVKGGHVPDITSLNQYKGAKKDANTTLQFFVMGTAEPDITWYKDGKQLENPGSTRYHANGTYIAELEITSAQYSDSGLYTCTAQNQFGTSSANITLAVRGIPEAPINVTVKHTSPYTVLVSWLPGYNGGANCTFSVQFKRSGATAWTSSDAVLGNATSTVLRNKQGWNGLFVFRVAAVNQFGSSESSEIPVTFRDNVVPQKRADEDPSIGAIVGGVIGGVLVILLVIAVVLILCRKKKRKKGPPKPLPSVLYSVVEEDQYTYADANANQSTAERCDTYSYVTIRPDAAAAMAAGGGSDYASISRPKQWEVPKRNVRLDKKLGSGHFGMVMKGFLKTKQGIQVVAVKMLKENAEQQQKKEFLDELELMKPMAPHPNIVGLVGCCTKSDQPFIIVEYCSMGNLKDFLRSSHGSVIYANMAGNSLTLTNRDLLSFAWQCARGMSYLASQKLVHRDLAARNILVDKGHVCKIADFGLARDIYEKKQYLKIGEGELPLRWMAIESIFQGITTTKSDVWSYGVLLWEIVTLGADPYPGMTRDQVIGQLHIGYRMPKPQYCSDELYSIMWQCWQQDPESRPTFLELGKTLHRLMTAQKISIDLNNFDVSYINAPEEQ